MEEEDRRIDFATESIDQIKQNFDFLKRFNGQNFYPKFIRSYLYIDNNTFYLKWLGDLKHRYMIEAYSHDDKKWITIYEDTDIDPNNQNTRTANINFDAKQETITLEKSFDEENQILSYITSENTKIISFTLNRNKDDDIEYLDNTQSKKSKTATQSPFEKEEELFVYFPALGDDSIDIDLSTWLYFRVSVLFDFAEEKTNIDNLTDRLIIEKKQINTVTDRINSYKLLYLDNDDLILSIRQLVDLQNIFSEKTIEFQLFPYNLQYIYETNKHDISDKYLDKDNYNLDYDVDYYRIYLPFFIGIKYINYIRTYFDDYSNHLEDASNNNNILTTYPILSINELWNKIKFLEYYNIDTEEVLTISDIVPIWLYYRLKTSVFQIIDIEINIGEEKSDRKKSESTDNTDITEDDIMDKTKYIIREFPSGAFDNVYIEYGIGKIIIGFQTIKRQVSEEDVLEEISSEIEEDIGGKKKIGGLVLDEEESTDNNDNNAVETKFGGLVLDEEESNLSSDENQSNIESEDQDVINNIDVVEYKNFNELDARQQSTIIGNIIKYEINPLMNREQNSNFMINSSQLRLFISKFNEDLINTNKIQTKSIEYVDSVEQILAKDFNMVDAYDNHTLYTEYQMKLARPYQTTLEYDLFNCLIVNKEVPFCCLNLDEYRDTVKTRYKFVSKKQWYKVDCEQNNEAELRLLSRFEETKWFNDHPSLSLIFYILIPVEYQTSKAKSKAKKQKIDLDGNLNNINESDYIKIIYSFKNGTNNFNALHFKINNNLINIEHIAKIIRAHIPEQCFIFDNPKQISIKQEYRIPHMIIGRKRHIGEPRSQRKSAKKKSSNIDEDEIENDYTFLTHEITTSEFASLFRINEYETPFSLRTRFEFNMYMLGETRIAMTVKQVKKENLYDKHHNKNVVLLKDDNYINISIKSNKENYISMTRTFINILLNNYINHYNDIYELYNAFFPNVYENISKSFKAKKSSSRKFHPGFESILPKRVIELDFDLPSSEFKKIIKQLRAVDPELFNEKYSKKAGHNIGANETNMVIYIPPHKVQERLDDGYPVVLWPVLVEGLPDELQAKRYYNHETGEGIANFYTCKNGKNNKIELIRNNGTNADTFPYFLKCVSTGENIIINQDDFTIQLNPNTKLEKTNTDYIQKKLVVLRENTKGLVPNNFETLFNMELFRLGVQRSTSSILYCIRRVINDDDFKNAENKDDIISQDRKKIAKYAVLCMQENPGKTIKEVKANIKNKNVILHPKFYFRAIEYYYDINLYTFTSDNNVLTLEHPNRAVKTEYIRQIRNSTNKIIMVAKMNPSEADVDKNIQYELIVKRIQNTNNFELDFSELEENFNRRLFITLETMFMNTINNFNIQQVISGTSETNELIIRKDVGIVSTSHTRAFYNIINLVNLKPSSTKIKITSQWLDQRGKLRGITINFNDKEISLITPPLEPLYIDIEEPVYTSLDTCMKFIDYLKKRGKVDNIRFTPSQNKEQENKILGVGFGFQRDIINTITNMSLKEIFDMPKDKLETLLTNVNLDFFIPVEPYNWNEFLQKQPNRPMNINFNNPFITALNPEQKSLTKKYYDTRKVAILLFQIIKHLVIKWIQNNNMIDDFFNSKLFSINKDYTYNWKQSKPKKFIGQSRRLLIEGDFDTLKSYFIEQYPGFFTKEGAIKINDYKFIDNVKIHIKTFLRERKRQTNISYYNGNDDIENYLQYYYEVPDDFERHNSNEVIFMSHDRFQLAIDMETAKLTDIMTIIDKESIEFEFPYVLNYKDMGLYIVQNVNGGDKLSALNVLYFWQYHRINLGFYTQPIDDIDKKIIAFKTVSYRLKNELDITQSYLIKYTDNQYGALLLIS